MRTISIYYRPLINIDVDGKVITREIHEPEGDVPHFFYDGARYDLKEDDIEKLRRNTQNAVERSC